jgi:hypothetical protein
MIVFFVSVIGYVVMCVAPSLQCTQVPIDALQIALLGGAVELVFEIPIAIKIYKLKDK